MSAASAPCGRCGKAVFHAEEVKAVGKRFHEACFKCKTCGKQLSSVDVFDNEGEIYCTKCYAGQFGPKGFRGVTSVGAAYVGPDGSTGEEVATGLDADIKKKLDAKYDPKLEAQAQAWIESKVGHSLEGGFAAGLKDGTVLAALLNNIKPGSVVGVKKSGMSFVQMENIGKFLTALQEHFAFKASDVFMTVDLYEAKNLGQVVNCILMLKRVVGE